MRIGDDAAGLRRLARALRSLDVAPGNNGAWRGPAAETAAARSDAIDAGWKRVADPLAAVADRLTALAAAVDETTGFVRRCELELGPPPPESDPDLESWRTRRRIVQGWIDDALADLERVRQVLGGAVDEVAGAVGSASAALDIVHVAGTTWNAGAVVTSRIQLRRVVASRPSWRIERAAGHTRFDARRIATRARIDRWTPAVAAAGERVDAARSRLLTRRPPPALDALGARISARWPAAASAGRTATRVLGPAGTIVSLGEAAHRGVSGDGPGAVASGAGAVGGLLVVAGGPVTLAAGTVLLAGSLAYEFRHELRTAFAWLRSRTRRSTDPKDKGRPGSR